MPNKVGRPISVPNAQVNKREAARVDMIIDAVSTMLMEALPHDKYLWAIVVAPSVAENVGCGGSISNLEPASFGPFMRDFVANITSFDYVESDKEQQH